MTNQTDNRMPWPELLAVALFLLFAALVLNHAFFFTMDADEAFNADIAKNWLAGYGYSSSLGVIFPFDAYISSGPAYTFVQAIAIGLWGNDPDMQKPFIAVVHLLLFANVLRLLYARMMSGWQFLALVLFSLTSYSLLEFKFWHRPAGELLSLLYFLNGALVLADAMSRQRAMSAVMAGFFLASAVLTKGQALLWLAGLAPPVLYRCWHERRWQQVGILSLVALVFLIPVSGWQYYKDGVLADLARKDPALYEYGIAKDWHFFSTHGSGLYLLWEVGSWQDLLRCFNSTTHLAFNKFREIFGVYGVAGIAYAGAVPLLTLAMLFRSKRSDPGFLFLVFPLLAFLLWAFLLNNSVYTHQMLPAVWFWVLLSGWWCARQPRLLFALASLNIAVLLTHALENDEQSCLLTRDAACLHLQSNPVRTSRNNALAYLDLHALPAPLANCGWYFAQDIEFSMPGINHIQDCMRLFDDAVEFDRDAFITVNKLPEHFRETRTTDELIDIFVNKRKNLFGGTFVAPVRWKKPLEFTFVAGIYMMGDSLEIRRNVMSFLDHCSGVLYRDRFYAIQHCSYDDLQAYVSEWGGMPIFTHAWEARYYADFMYTTRVQHRNPLQMRPY